MSRAYRVLRARKVIKACRVIKVRLETAVHRVFRVMPDLRGPPDLPALRALRVQQVRPDQMELAPPISTPAPQPPSPPVTPTHWRN